MIDKSVQCTLGVGILALGAQSVQRDISTVMSRSLCLYIRVIYIDVIASLHR